MIQRPIDPATSDQPDPTKPQPPAIRLYQPEPQRPRRRVRDTPLDRYLERIVIPPMELRNRSPRTIADLRLAVREWDAYWRAKAKPDQSDTRIQYPCLIGNIRSKHLEEWQHHLACQTSTKTGRRVSACTVNRKLGAIRQILVAAERRGHLRRRPRVAQLTARAAAKHYLRVEQIESLWSACAAAQWPSVGNFPPAAWWRCALVLYWIYGFRTQELIAFQPGQRPLTWLAVSDLPETPNPVGTAQCQFGWLSYTPQKQAWAKPEPLYLPLTAHARAAIDTLGKATGIDARERLFPWPKSQRDFYAAWYAIGNSARLTTKSGGQFLIKHLRKSAATHLERHRKGLGLAVCGWGNRDTGDDRVMRNHYLCNEDEVVEAMLSYRVPACFDALLPRDSGDQMDLFE
jgi:hypothetical protein